MCWYLPRFTRIDYSVGGWWFLWIAWVQSDEERQRNWCIYAKTLSFDCICVIYPILITVVWPTIICEPTVINGYLVSNRGCKHKQVLDEHLFLQRRLRREMFALIHNRKAPSWEWSRGGAFSIFLQRSKTLHLYTFNAKEGCAVMTFL